MYIHQENGMTACFYLASWGILPTAIGENNLECLVSESHN